MVIVGVAIASRCVGMAEGMGQVCLQAGESVAESETGTGDGRTWRGRLREYLGIIWMYELTRGR
jgi:hypothetical protein